MRFILFILLALSVSSFGQKNGISKLDIGPKTGELQEDGKLTVEPVRLHRVYQGDSILFRARIANFTDETVVIQPEEVDGMESFKLYCRTPITLKPQAVSILPCQINTDGLPEEYNLEITFSSNLEGELSSIKIPVSGNLVIR